MTFTIAEKFLTEHTSRDAVHPGELIEADLDFIFGNDITAPLTRHCMEDVDPAFVQNVAAGYFIVAGKNFGCGSSREHVPISVKHTQIYVGTFESRGVDPLCSAKTKSGE